MRIQDTWDTLRRNWSSRPPIDDVAAFDSLEEALGQNLPANYKAFLMESNGGETLEPLPHIRLYGLGELRPSELPDVLEIASGSGDAYGFDLTVNRDSAYYPVVKYQLGDRNRTRRRRVSRHFGEFLSQIASGEELEWRARIDISRSSAERSSLHFCDQPEGNITVQQAWEALRRSWSSDQPINDRAEFDEVEKVLGQPLPADYKWFLMQSNGGETLDPLEHLTLYSLQELLPRSTDGQPPDVLEIANNGSDGYAFDLTVNRDTGRYPVVKYSLGGLDRAFIERAARHFAEFLGIVASGEEP